MVQTLIEIAEERGITIAAAREIQARQKQAELASKLKPAEAQSAAIQSQAEQAQRERSTDQAALLQGVADRREMADREEALKAWVDSGGAPAEFQDQWPQLRLERIRQRTLAALASQPSNIFKPEF